MSTPAQDACFLNSAIPSVLLSLVRNWIAVNMSPEDVFSTNALELWADDHGFEKVVD